MCGIAGWIDHYDDLREQDAQMAKLALTLAPRGPDEGGIYKSRECFFVHRRLTVVDPAGGRQPMTRANPIGDRYIVCYNGELYNTEEVRELLKKEGYTHYYGHSDTEVLLTAYMAWGDDCLEKLNGIFAFAIWDEKRKRLFLARDRAGVKPLFYHIYDGGIVFASDIKTLLAHSRVPRVIDREGVAEIALMGPGRSGGNAVFRDIKSLPPGTSAVFTKEDFRTTEYWKLTAKENNETFDETCANIRELLFDSIEKQLVSDVPLCCFLSGGLDSSLISAVAANKYRQKGRILNTFSVDYQNQRDNFKSSLFQPDEDAPWIEKMSAHIGSAHADLVFDYSDLAATLNEATDARSLPGMGDVDSSFLLFCRGVKQDYKFPVAISGECADE